MLSSYEHLFPFKCVVFSDSLAVHQLSEFLHLECRNSTEKNVFGLPVLKTMLKAIQDSYSYDYIGYLNSDILLHPGVFRVLDSVTLSIQQNDLVPDVILASRVANAKYENIVGACENLSECLERFASIRSRSRMRSLTSAVNHIILTYL